METPSLQASHDDVAHTLTDFADQLLRGSHNPTLAQWIAVANALDTAALHMRPEANPKWTAEVAALIAKKASEPTGAWVDRCRYRQTGAGRCTRQEGHAGRHTCARAQQASGA